MMISQTINKKKRTTSNNNNINNNNPGVPTAQHDNVKSGSVPAPRIFLDSELIEVSLFFFTMSCDHPDDTCISKKCLRTGRRGGACIDNKCIIIVDFRDPISVLFFNFLKYIGPTSAFLTCVDNVCITGCPRGQPGCGVIDLFFLTKIKLFFYIVIFFL